MIKPNKEYDAGFVYCIYGETTPLAKIGFSDDPLYRLRSLSCYSPVPLHLLGVWIGTRESERIMHETFAELRAHCEWFTLTAELFRIVRELTTEWLSSWETGSGAYNQTSIRSRSLDRSGDIHAFLKNQPKWEVVMGEGEKVLHWVREARL